VFVAEWDEQLVGYIDVWASYHPSHHRALRYFMRRLLGRRLTPSIVQPRHIGWVEDCYVSLLVRQQGVGQALVQAGLVWLQAQSIKRVELAVLAANRGGTTFREKQGFAPFRLLMAKEMDSSLPLY